MLDTGDDPRAPGFCVPPPATRQGAMLQDQLPQAKARLFAQCSRLVLLPESLPAPRHRARFRCWSGREGCRQKLKDKQNQTTAC